MVVRRLGGIDPDRARKRQFTFMLATPDDSIDDEIWGLVRDELVTGWHFEAVQAKTRQLRIAQANARIEHATVEGLGQHVASIDAFAFTDWERRNPGITRDPDWLQSLLRDNPECRVAYTPRTTTITHPGLP